jgi:ankyrin repeat protein
MRGVTVDQAGRTPLHYAALEGRVDDVQRMIADGADVGATDNSLMTPLHMACQQGQLDAAATLVDAGAPINALDVHGNGPLWRAVFAYKQGGPELVRLLLDAGADPDAHNHAGASPRDLAQRMLGPDAGALFS